MVPVLDAADRLIYTVMYICTHMLGISLVFKDHFKAALRGFVMSLKGINTIRQKMRLVEAKSTVLH